MNSKIVWALMGKTGGKLMIMFVGLTVLSSCSSEQNNNDSFEEEMVAEVQESEAPEESGKVADEATAGLPHHLEQCTAYSETFTHPFTGDKLIKEVVGLNTNGRCKYKEELPSDGLMTCKFSEETRRVIAQFYENQDRFRSFGGLRVTYKLDGKTVENPLDAVLKNGDCTISGY